MVSLSTLIVPKLYANVVKSLIILPATTHVPALEHILHVLVLLGLRLMIILHLAEILFNYRSHSSFDGVIYTKHEKIFIFIVCNENYETSTYR